MVVVWCGGKYNRPGRANSCFRLRRLYLICLGHTTIHHRKPQLVMCGLCAPPRLHRQEEGVLQRPRRAPVAQQASHAGPRRGYPEGEASETAKSVKIQNLDHDSALADAQKHSVCPCRQRFCHSRGLLTVLGVEVGVHSCSRLTQRTTSAQVWLSLAVDPNVHRCTCMRGIGSGRSVGAGYTKLSPGSGCTPP